MAAPKKKKPTGVLPWAWHQLNNIGNAPTRILEAAGGTALPLGVMAQGAKDMLYNTGPGAPSTPAGTPNSTFMAAVNGTPNLSAADVNSIANSVGIQTPSSTMGTAAPADYMAMFNQLLGTMSGPAPSFSFDASPYQQAIQQVQTQGELGRGVINQGGTDLMARLAQLRSQTETRGAEDRAAIANTQGKALSAAQGSLSPVLADLQRQGVDVRAIEQNANQRIGTMSDQAALQNTLSQRLAQNTGQVLDATGRSAATQGAGALNQLAVNLSGAVNAIGQKQAAAGAAAQNQYLQDLGAYNKNRMGIGQELLGTIQKLGADSADPSATVRSEWAGKSGKTAEAVNGFFNQLEGNEWDSPDDLIGAMSSNKEWVEKIGADGKPEKNSDGSTKMEHIDQWEKLARQGVNVESVKAAIKTYTKKPKNQNPLALLGIK